MGYKKEVLGYKSNYLFPKEEMFPRETVLQSEFNDAFKPMADVVVGAMNSACGTYHDFFNDHPLMERDNKSFPAIFWNSAIREQLLKIPQLECDYLEGAYRRLFLKIGRAKLFIKKVDHKYSTSNIETAAVQMYRDQLTDDEDDKDMVLILGYQLDETERHIIDVSVICRIGDRIEWVTDVYDLCNSEQNNSIATLKFEHPTINEQDEVEVTTKPNLVKVQRE